MRNAPLPAVALAACASLLWSATQTDAGRPVRSGAPEADDRRLAEVVGLAAPASAAPRQALRCNPQARRVIEPLVLEEGFSFEVKVHYDYSCPEGTQPVVFVLAVEGSDMLRPMGFMGREVLGNVQDGLKAFVEEIDFANGSLGGMIIYTANASVRVPMGGGETTKDALIAASDALSPGGASARGAAEAVTTSKEMLTSADAPDGAFKVIVLVDVGASVGDEEEVIGTCEAARADGIHVSVMALRNAETRLMPCSEEALYRQSAREGAQDVPEKLREMGYGFTHGNEATGVLISDALETGMTYVEGSGVPEPSSSFGGELTWDLAGPPPAGGQDVVYRVRPQAPGEGPLSAAAVLNMVYADSTLGEIPLENPDVCVHSSTRPQDCADFIATLTPQVPTPTSTEGPTEQATAETSPTATRAPGWAIFVPDVHMP